MILLHRFDLGSGIVTPISPPGERAIPRTWNRKGDRLVFTTAMIDRNNPERTARTTLHLMDPARPESLRTLAKWEGGSWSSFRFSEDGRRLAYLEVVSSNQRHVWVMDVATGKKRRVSAPSPAEPVAYAEPWFSRDGRGLFLASDHGSEFRRLVYLDLADGKERTLTAHLRHDVVDMEISFDAGLIAFVTNEAGAHVLRFMDLTTMKELPRPALVSGVIGGLAWRRNSSEIGFHITSARSAGDVFSYDQKEHRLTRWTNGNNPDVNTSEFSEPRVVKWSSFDGLEITGLHYHPPARFKGKRPVLVSIHGGPASQARPTFIGRNNYLVNELGIAIIYPNVRGSRGFGKTFLKLDDGMKREDSVKDIGALLDWIAKQPALDKSRVLVTGGSYGGYMTLAAMTHYNDRLRAGLDVVGISNFVTFLTNTESYRRDLRRVEYGDERDPAMRDFLERISPLNNAQRINKPLFVVQGKNDPRVPWTESEQIVRKLQARNSPVWYLLADNEGHGFARRENADFYFATFVKFLETTVFR